MILTCIYGRNADLIKDVADQYFKPGDKIADVTYGKGNFWTKVDLSQYDFYPSDIKTGIDFRDLPYEDDFFNVLALDPPYVHSAGGFKIAANYNNSLITGKHVDVIRLYDDGMREAYRVITPGGLLLLKCQDTVEYRQQRWSHIELFNLAEALNFYPLDLFVLH